MTSFFTILLRGIGLGLSDAIRYTVLLTSTKYFFFKFLKKNKKLGDYVDLANDQALVKYHYFWSCQS